MGYPEGKSGVLGSEGRAAELHLPAMHESPSWTWYERVLELLERERGRPIRLERDEELLSATVVTLRSGDKDYKARALVCVGEETSDPGQIQAGVRVWFPGGNQDIYRDAFFNQPGEQRENSDGRRRALWRGLPSAGAILEQLEGKFSADQTRRQIQKAQAGQTLRQLCRRLLPRTRR